MATRKATVYTHLGIETAFPLGQGYGPLNHMHALTIRSVPWYVHVCFRADDPSNLCHRATKSNPHPFTRLLIQSTAGLWKEYVEHDFVKQLARGTLPRECFIHFIK